MAYNDSMEITEKQTRLLIVINNRRSKYGSFLTLREMVSEAKVSDVKSVHRMIKTLMQKGFLYKDRNVRGILLTDLALQKLGLLIPKDKFEPSISSSINFKREQSFVEQFKNSQPYVSNSTPNDVAYGNKNIKLNGTSIHLDVNSIVRSIASLMLGKHKINGARSMSNLTSILPKGVTLTFISLVFGLLIIESFVFFVFVKITDSNMLLSFILSIFSVIVITLLVRKENI